MWIELLSLAASRNGDLGTEKEIQLALRRRPVDVHSALSELSAGGLLDLTDGRYRPHDWNDYQMKSYSSAERMRKHRAKSDVTVTPSTITNTNTITEKENTELRSVKEKPPKKVLKRSQLEEDDWPDEREVEIATKAGMSAVTIDLEWERFRSHHIAKGSLMANWTQAWVTWTVNWKRFGSEQAKGSNVHAFEKAGTKGSWRH